MADKKTSEETDLGTSYSDDTLIRVTESGNNYKQRYADLATYIASKLGGNTPITRTWTDFLTAHAAGGLQANATYAISDPNGFTGYTLFVNTLSTSTISNKALLYGTFDSLAKVLQVDLAVVDGTFASYIYNRIYDPLANNVWYGHPDGNGTDGRAFFDAMMSQSDLTSGGNYSGVTVEKDCNFNGFPAVSHFVKYGTRNSDAAYYFGSNCVIQYSSFGHNSDVYITLGDNSIVRNSNIGSIGINLGAGSIMENIAGTLDGNNYITIPAGVTVRDGVIGGRGCSAELSTTVDLGGSDTIDFSTLPLCKTLTISNVDSGGLINITGWNSPENHGAKIFIQFDAPTVVDVAGSGNILLSASGASAASGAFTITVSTLEVLLYHDGYAYVTDYIS
jgi:hypothetical protein